MECLTVLQEMLQCGFCMDCSSFRAYAAAPVQFSPEVTVCMSSSVPGTLSHASSLIWRLTLLFPHLFFPSFFCILVFFLALQYVFREVTPVLLWSCLGAFFLSGLFPQRPSCSPPAANTSPHKLTEKQTKAKHNPTAHLNGMDINNIKFAFDVRKVLAWSYRSVNM